MPARCLAVVEVRAHPWARRRAVIWARIQEFASSVAQSSVLHEVSGSISHYWRGGCAI